MSQQPPLFTLPPIVEIDGVRRSTVNSAGRPIHPSPEGVRAFWEWFGDSQAVDAHGRPLVLYHGTGADFSVFRRTWSGEFGPAIYTTDNPREAGEYGAGQQKPGVNILPIYVSLKNPYTKGVDAFWQEFGRDDGDAAAVQRAHLAGYDGVLAQRPDTYYDNERHEFIDQGDMLTHFVAFAPSQIKSALGNRGTFDPDDADITRSMGLDDDKALPVPTC